MPSLRHDILGEVGLAVLLAELRDAVAFIDSSGRVLLANNGVAVGPPESRDRWDLGADAARFRADGQRYASRELPVMRSILTGEHVRDEECFRRGGGQRSHRLSCRAAPIRDETGTVVAAVLIERDVTRRLRGQRQLATLTSVVGDAGLAVIALDAKGHVTEWDRSAARLYGWSAFSAVGRPIRSLLKLDLDDERCATVGAAVRTHGRWRGEISVRRRDGALLIVEATAFPTRESGNEITGYVVIHRDLRDEKRAEAELRAARARADEILDRIGDAVFAVDRQWRYTYLNRRAVAHAREALGREVTAEELLGQTCWEVFPDWTHSPFYEAFQQALLDQRAVEIEGYVPRADRWFDARLYPSKTGLSIYLCDVTERWGARRELERGIAQQAAVAALGLRALQGESVSALLEEAASEVRRGLGAEYSRVDELLPDGQQLRARAGAGWPPGIVGSLILRVGRGSLTGFALLTGGPVIVDDLPAETRFEVPDHLRENEVMSAIAVVIDPLRKPFGTLLALSKQRHFFSEQDASFMQSLANVLATAIDRADVERRLEEAREAERARIARDLHDEALRELNDAFALAALSRPVAASDHDQEHWTAMTETLRRVGQRLRGAIYDLRVPTDDERALADLLADVVSAQSAMDGDLAIRLDGATSLPHGSLGHAGSELLRIVREAITNARCHSGATTIAVDTGRSTGNVVRITVADNGRWPGRREVVRGRRGTGIAGMFDRAERLGATLRITGRKDGGTLVSVALSLDSPAGP